MTTQSNPTLPIVKIRASVARNLGALAPVASLVEIPAIEGWPGMSDAVTLQPGQWLEIVEHGDAENWSRAIVRG